MGSELQFEKDLITYLQHLGGQKQWEYLPQIKTTNQLWANFKHILEANNQNRLTEPLSVDEFAQIKAEISRLNTPYAAGQFLYGFNGISQVEVNLDNGEHTFLTVFDQAEVGAGNTTYQIVNQIKRPNVLPGKENRRFDTTLLINGLPIIQIEEKATAHEAQEALNQMHQYILEGQYSDIFSTVQILVGMTPNSIRYMANTTGDTFNTAFAFNWQREKDNSTIRDWREFSNQFLSIPMAHNMATSYMILDGTHNKQSIKVMRPYQVYATRRIIEALRTHDFKYGKQEVGYIWHTTGSGKTISSFKAAWLASRLPNVDKVVFMVDRIALTNQTAANYAAYDPDADDSNKGGVVSDTQNVGDLNRKLKNKNGIIVTSIQKMDWLVRRKSFKAPDKNIVFIVDEAHRSTAGEMMQRIKEAFKHSAWIGYTSTPSFEGITTRQLFGDVLHTYTIREAIADGNVLGFKVDFNTTIPLDSLRTEYLPRFYAKQYPQWTQQDIQNKIDHLSPADMDDLVNPSVYDMNPTHVQLVVKDVLNKWRNRSDDYRYSGLFTTHVGGGKASIPMAVMYYREFKKQNAALERPLQIAISFSQDNSNGDNMITTNTALSEAMKDYSAMFGNHFDDTNATEYAEDVVARLNRTINDDRYLDLVIVVDQLLTGFDAPTLNTLYVDRTLHGAGLIQAYSRTNRIQDMVHKPYGRIVNYRWPEQSEKLMNEALAVYANRDSANENLPLVIDDTGVIAPSFDTLITEAQKCVAELRTLSFNITDLPKSEAGRDQMYEDLKTYNRLISQLKQDDQYDYRDPDKLLKQIGLTGDEETLLTTSLAHDLKRRIAQHREIEYSDLTLEMQHVRDIQVNYDYLEELVARLANEVHEGCTKAAEGTFKEVNKMADQLEDEHYALQVKRTASGLLDGSAQAEHYPVESKDARGIITAHNNTSKAHEIGEFMKRWGLLEITPEVITTLIDRHVPGQDDLDEDGSIRKIQKIAQTHYRDYASDEQVAQLAKVRYRNQLREALTNFANYIKKNY
ncbi:type I restriction endonuclease subunit R [Lacticaseibacillus thailandensis]|nr:HsdR family type I site-specific deoxyribonuclease [Lacticaseibacillus thailandensis]